MQRKEIEKQVLDMGIEICDRPKRESGGWAENGKCKRLKIDCWGNQKLGAIE